MASVRYLFAISLLASSSCHVQSFQNLHQNVLSTLHRPRQVAVATTLQLEPHAAIEALHELGVVNPSVQVLSSDPLLFVVSNFLSKEECMAYQEYVSDRSMTRSNPPEVSLDPAKLWPLPILATLSGLPPLVRLFSESTSDPTIVDIITPIDILGAVLPNVVVAFALMASLAWLVVLPWMRKMANESSRTSVACALNTVDDLPFIHDLLQRACVVVAQLPNHWEAPVVTRYDPGAIFSRHGDASPTRGSEWKDLGGQRIVTCICYLNTVRHGGETYFDKLDIAIKPTMGSALFFQPADATTWQADDRTTHESLPTVGDSDKWIVQLFGRANVVPPPLGLPNEVKLAKSSS